MRRWLLQGRFTAEGLGSVADDGGSAVRKKLDALAEAVNCKLEAFYFTLGGQYHTVAIITTPDALPGAIAAWGGYLASERGGLVSSDATELVDPSAVDEAAKSSRKVAGATR